LLWVSVEEAKFIFATGKCIDFNLTHVASVALRLACVHY
jgi:hypothetical protein